MATNLLDQRIGFTADGATLDYEAFDGVAALEDADDVPGLFVPALGVELGRTVGSAATLTWGLEEQSPMGYANNYDSDVIVQTSPASPVISNFVPAPGTAINPGDPLQFDVTAIVSLRLTALVVSYAGGGRELVYDDAGFTPAFATSSRTAISGGYRYVLRRTGGWPSAPTLIPYVVDTFGDEVP